MRLSLLFLFLGLTGSFLGLTGCAGSSPTAQPPRSLAEVNRLLEGREVQIERMDGTIIPAYDVMVGPDSTRFASRSRPPVLPTHSVRRITYGRDRISPGAGAMGGAATGIAFVGLVMLSEGEVSPLTIGIGSVIVAGGAVVGLLVGMLENVGEQDRVAYEGPVSRYGR